MLPNAKQAGLDCVHEHGARSLRTRDCACETRIESPGPPGEQLDSNELPVSFRHVAFLATGMTDVGVSFATNRLTILSTVRTTAL